MFTQQQKTKKNNKKREIKKIRKIEYFWKTKIHQTFLKTKMQKQRNH